MQQRRSSASTAGARCHHLAHGSRRAGRAAVPRPVRRRGRGRARSPRVLRRAEPGLRHWRHRRYAATFTPGCRACATIKERLNADTAKGNRLDGLRDEVSDLKVKLGTNNTAFVNVKVNVPAYRRLGPEGQVLGTFTASSSTFNMTLNKAADTWKVIDITDAAS